MEQEIFDPNPELSPRAFKALVAAGGISSASIRSFSNGFLIVVRVGLREQVIAAARGGLRYYTTLDGAASVLQQAGIRKFDVDTSNWSLKASNRLTAQLRRSSSHREAT